MKLFLFLFHRQMANKRKERYFETLSVPLLDDIKLKSQIINLLSRKVKILRQNVKYFTLLTGIWNDAMIYL